MTLRTDVSVLYVDPRGPYPKLVADWWDEKRDAKHYGVRYEGRPVTENPVVAHPPCGPWGRLKFLNKHQDPACGIRAVGQVRHFGGVLEHPEHSTLFRDQCMPWPGELPDAWGGRTYRVDQSAWGHRCKKATWLYVVGVPDAVVRAGIRTGGNPTHRVTNGSRGDTSLPRVSSLEARLSPPAFAEWLISLAAQAKPAARSA